MNLRCAFCQTPYTLSRNDKLIALQHMDAEKLSHYDTHCPRCRKATRVQRKMLEATFPNWREALHELETQVESFDQTQDKAAPASAPKPEAVADALQGTPVAQAESKPAHKSRTHAKAKPEAPKPATKTSSPKGKAATKKSK
jgi:hypothetical protein